MVIGPSRIGGADDAQTSRHAEMQNQRPLATAEKQILRSALDRANLLARQDRAEAARNWPSQPRVADHYPGNSPRRKEGFDAAPRNFDFRKLRHRKLVRSVERISLSRRGNILNSLPC